MCDELLTSLEGMIRAARSCPVPSMELRRQTLAKAIRAYHERAQRRKIWIAATLLFGFVWMAGSARQLLAQPGRDLVEARLSQFQDEVPAKDSAAADTDEWQAVERTLRSRTQRYQLLKRALGPNDTSHVSGSAVGSS